MFLFAHKTETPLSTYTDSYRVPVVRKHIYEEPSVKEWSPNEHITKGLTIPRVDQPIDQSHLEKMVKKAVQEYSYKNSIEPTAYRPYKYWVSREEEKFNPVFIGNDRYASWRTGPYNSASWNRYTTYLPRIPRVSHTHTRASYLQRWRREREVVVNMLNSLSRKQLPYVRHQYPIPGRMPYQGYYSPCTGRHYCLRGMDYYVDGAPSTERQISQLVEKIVRFGGFGLAAASSSNSSWGSFGGRAEWLGQTNGAQQ
uniref:Sperm microtubule inner protein 6 n=1 Tax=Laticauda laticaudata TaxID=8630 RepID=A0A8C5RVX6_LATLA